MQKAQNLRKVAVVNVGRKKQSCGSLVLGAHQFTKTSSDVQLSNNGLASFPTRLSIKSTISCSINRLCVRYKDTQWMTNGYATIWKVQREQQIHNFCLNETSRQTSLYTWSTNDHQDDNIFHLFITLCKVHLQYLCVNITLIGVF